MRDPWTKKVEVDCQLVKFNVKWMQTQDSSNPFLKWAPPSIRIILIDLGSVFVELFLFSLGFSCGGCMLGVDIDFSSAFPSWGELKKLSIAQSICLLLLPPISSLFYIIYLSVFFPQRNFINIIKFQHHSLCPILGYLLYIVDDITNEIFICSKSLAEITGRRFTWKISKNDQQTYFRFST